MSNAPTTLLGHVPMFRAILTSSVSATATTVTPDDSGTLFIDASTSTHTYTLPAVADCKGKVFWFAKIADAVMIVSGGTADKMIGLNDAALDYLSFQTANEGIGAALLVVGDGNYYIPFNMSSGAHTVTVKS